MNGTLLDPNMCLFRSYNYNLFIFFANYLKLHVKYLKICVIVEIMFFVHLTSLKASMLAQNLFYGIVGSPEESTKFSTRMLGKNLKTFREFLNSLRNSHIQSYTFQN